MEHHERARFHERCVATRGAPYRRIQTLVFSPSRDLGKLGNEFLLENRRRLLYSGFLGALFSLNAGRIARSESDLFSYLLFDGGYTQQLIKLGRQDVEARADEVRAFFET